MCQMSVNRTKSFAIVRIVHIEQLLGVLGNTGTGDIVNIFSGNKGASDEIVGIKGIVVNTNWIYF